jgi:hypothetical protein
MTDERTIAKFLRGLTIGALLGAIIAGSRIWARWSAREQRREGARRREP